MSESKKLGEQFGEFLRGLLQVQDTVQQVQIPSPKKKYIAVDSTEILTGTTASLEMQIEGPEAPGSFRSDVTFNGIVQFSSGKNFPLQQIIAKDYANALSLRPDPNRPDIWNVVADGDPQSFSSPGSPPPSADSPSSPYEVTFLERTIADTSVVRISGNIFNPMTQNRVIFTVTHDPADIVVVGIVASLAAVICGGVVLIEAITNHCTEQGKIQCGKRGVHKIILKRKYGFSWKRGGPEIGCGEECTIECNP